MAIISVKIVKKYERIRPAEPERVQPALALCKK